MNLGKMRNVVTMVQSLNEEIEDLLKYPADVADELAKANKIKPGEKISLRLKVWETKYNHKMCTEHTLTRYFVSFGITRFGNVKLITSNRKDLLTKNVHYTGEWVELVTQDGRLIKN